MIPFVHNGSVIKKYGSIFVFALLILTGCEKESSGSKEEKIFFETVWKLDKQDYYLDGTLVESIEYDVPSYVHYFNDLALGIVFQDGRYYRSIFNYSYADLHMLIALGIPERVVTSVNQTSMVIETNGFERAFSTEVLEYDHSVSYYSAVKTSSLASSIEGEWNNYKSELYRDGELVNTWDSDFRLKYSKDGRVTYLSPNSPIEEEYYLLVSDKLVFSKSAELSVVYTVSIEGNEMVQESNTLLGTTKIYYRKIK